ncbi:LLM class flavin-dependent oxidoreductase [Ruania zhangjianzhongii]|uniref:LLM class flavin-dependent oxidoreductase n=1 Tax=Ruania zhangjianzhongii TaxID=2603206 RepID=UPI0011CBBB0E|nr:LLM class flavin-dependent oxidoreductase [Ruania zhangjianzhongii]
MRFSINATNHSWSSPAIELAEVARRVDDSAVHTLWVDDHLVLVDPTADPDGAGHLEAYTLLGHLAARTSRVRLGTMVSAATFRAPALLIAAVTTLDVLSQGRAWFGIGAGHHADEATDLGLDFPGVGARMDRLDDVLALAEQMWRGDRSEFIGTGIRLRAPRCQPAPVQPGGPPVLIGGTGERRTLPLVARYADACNLFDIPDGGTTVRRKLAVLGRYCVEQGRDPAEIEATMSTRLSPDTSTDDLLRKAEEAAGWGISHLVLITGSPWAPEALATVTGAAARV